MYTFIDTTDKSKDENLPVEALKLGIDGDYLEDLIPGYRTLYTSGREVIAPEMDTYDIIARDGTNIRNSRLPGRTITVGYQLIAEDAEAFREAFTELASILHGKTYELIFDDEPDKYFIGTVQEYGDIEPGRNAITSEIVFICEDPYKYSIEETEVEAETTENGDVITVNYPGTMPASPVLEAHFYESETEDDTSGDCGFVAFLDANEHILQFGDPEEPDEIEEKVDTIMTKPATSRTWTDSALLVNQKFTSLSGWTINSGGMKSKSAYVVAGSVTAARLVSGGSFAAKPSGYGSTSATTWHGPTLTKTLPSDGGNPATTGASDFEFNAQARFCSAKTNGKNQAGLVQVWIMASSGYVAGVSMWKPKGQTKGTIRCFVRGKGGVKDFNNVDFSYYNSLFGFKKKSTDKRPCNISITKKGTKITFNVGGKTFSYTSDAVSGVIATKASYYFAQHKATAAMSYNGIYSCTFKTTSRNRTATESATYADVMGMVDKPNTFSTNDILTADCRDASVKLNNPANDAGAGEMYKIDGGDAPGLGALGNDWETFRLLPGDNQILCIYSDWVSTPYKPTFKLRYRAKYL